ncbi:MAG: class probable F420-dependent enzyme family [Frankiales bacterium]|nr:class probable F420-dependent enzyme family [Frankiales bacterium]
MGPARRNLTRMTTFTELEIAYLKDQPLGRLATVQRHGQPQASPVAFAWNAATGTIDISGFRMAKTQKFRNLANNEHVAFVVDDIVSVDPWQVRCLEIRGVAEALTHPRDPAISVGDGAIIRIMPRRIISFAIDPDVPPSRDVESSS